MSEDKYIDKLDDFSRKVGEELREHQLPVDPAVWDALEGKLPPRRRLFPYWTWAAASVAAVVLVLFFLLKPPSDEPLLTAQSQTDQEIKQDTAQQAASSDVENDVDEEVDLQQTVNVEKATPEMVVRPDQTAVKGETIDLAEIVKPEKTIYPEKKVESEKTVKSETVVFAEQEVPVEELSVEEFSAQELSGQKLPTQELPVQEYPVQDLLAEELLAELPPSQDVREQRGLRSLIAALGSGGAPLDFSFNLYESEAPQDSSPGGDYHNGGGWLGGDYKSLTPDDYTDIEHRFPITFSLTAGFPIAKDLSLETGLSYTYLFSRFRRNDQFVYRGTLRQHYIGIPVNLRYTAWENDAWNVYLLGGVSAEKGLWSIYRQEIEHNGGIVNHTNVYSRIKGFQFSALGGAGFSYRLHGSVSLFGEPRIVYYFRNNQPMSARTENPLIFGLNMGIRLQFK